jgi:hypothetical protein
MKIQFARILISLGAGAFFTAVPVALLFPIAGRVRRRLIPGVC